jgi:hypothetical protein
MNERGGTLRISVVNMAEICRQGDKDQVNSIIDMIRYIGDCGLINIDPRGVIKKENLLISNPSSITTVMNPSAELEMVQVYLMAHNHPSNWHVADIIASLIPLPPSNSMSESSSRFLSDMRRLLQKGRGNSGYLKKSSDRFKKLKKHGPRYEAATRELLTMALDFVLKNEDMKMSNYSEWQDLFHVIVPVSYCDIAMIDKRWKTFISQTGFSYPNVAKIFDRKSLELFFETVEHWDPNKFE